MVNIAYRDTQFKTNKMKLQNKSYIFLLIFFFGSCVAKRNTSNIQETIKTDTIYKTKIIKEIERFTDTLTIENPCDSLGNLRPFKQLIKTKQGNISINGTNNTITAEIDLKGYKEILEETYKSKYEKYKSEYKNEVVIYRTPLWCYIYIICSIVIIVLLLRFR